MGGDSPRVLISAQPHLCTALLFLLEQQWGTHLLREVAEVSALVRRSEAFRPHIVLLDWDLLNPSETHVLSDLRKSHQCTYIIVLSSHLEPELEILAMGANVFIGKDKPPDKLVALLRALPSFHQRRNHASPCAASGTRPTQ